MNKVLLTVLFLLSGCVYQKPQEIFIDSNVSAFVFDGTQRIGETPFHRVMSRDQISRLTLQKAGYETAFIPAECVFSRSFESETGKMWDIFFENHNRNLDGALAFTTVLPFVPLAFLTDGTGTLTGYWIEYLPNMYYVEMVPEGKRETTWREIETKVFALKNFSALKLNEPEAGKTLQSLTGLSDVELAALIRQHQTPESLARAL